MAGNISYRGFGDSVGTKISYSPPAGTDASSTFIVGLVEQTSAGTPFKSTYPTKKSASALVWETSPLVKNADIKGKQFQVGVYSNQSDADAATNSLESDTIAFTTAMAGKVAIPNAVLVGPPRQVIQKIWDQYFPALYQYATGPVMVPGRKNIFSVSGYSGPMNPIPAGTSCGDVLNGVLQLMGCPIKTVFTHTMEVAQQHGAWITPSAAQVTLPKVGDMYVLHSLKSGASASDANDPSKFTEFAHTGFIKSAPDPYGLTASAEATWITVDGGAGSKAAGEQRALVSSPSGHNVSWQNGFLKKFSGDATNPTGVRMVMGWADLEIMMKG